MAQNKTNILSRLDGVSSLVGIVQAAFTNWAAISSYLSAGALMSALAYLQSLQPLYWGIAFFAGLIFVATIRAITKWGRSREAMARLYDATSATPTSFNRLEKEFVRQTIKASEMIHPVGQPIRDKAFIECEFHGPGLIVLSGCGFDGFEGTNVEFIRLHAPSGPAIPSKAYLANCHLRRCRYYNLVVAMTSESVDQLKAAMGGNIVVMGE